MRNVAVRVVLCGDRLYRGTNYRFRQGYSWGGVGRSMVGADTYDASWRGGQLCAM